MLVIYSNATTFVWPLKGQMDVLVFGNCFPLLNLALVRWERAKLHVTLNAVSHLSRTIPSCFDQGFELSYQRREKTPKKQ